MTVQTPSVLKSEKKNNETKQMEANCLCRCPDTLFCYPYPVWYQAYAFIDFFFSNSIHSFRVVSEMSSESPTWSKKCYYIPVFKLGYLGVISSIGSWLHSERLGLPRKVLCLNQMFYGFTWTFIFSWCLSVGCMKYITHEMHLKHSVFLCLENIKIVKN